ncbi:ATP-binding protein [Nonomuraea fuscirosea]|uniref:ATP-binding protein n=1 Tax=Nonomuraea fuscirosea TaxID=1291556 RepID=UPI001C634F87|nr:ATP-binding protein [Nonomuraea fuscirosea]
MAQQYARGIAEAHGHANKSARATLMAAMRALQALASEQQLSISAMQERHHDPQVLHDLMDIDHSNAQFGRRAQVIAVLCGAWPGRQRAASSLEDVVRGATSRIRDYLRVTVRCQLQMELTGRVVEPVVLVVAELLDNAARHSHPTTKVEVNIQQVHNGAVIVIDDGGVGMHPQETQQARLLLSGNTAVDVSRLGDPPKFGFPVIGVLSKRYGLSVSVDSQSPYGGVRAVVFLPHALLTPAEIAESPPMLLPTATAPHDDVSAPLVEIPVQGGLPRRRRRPSASSSIAANEESTPQSLPAPSARSAAARMGAFQRGSRAGRASAPLDQEEHGEE